MIYILIIFSIASSIFLTYFVIKISEENKIFDIPDEKRKIHQNPIPNIGGVAIFITLLLSFFLFFKNYLQIIGLNYVYTAIILIFLLGLKDDLIGLSALYRFLGQIIAGLIIIKLGDFRITEITQFGYGQLNYEMSILISLFLFVFLTNAFNLIDGINGLLGSLTFFSSISFFILFYLEKSFEHMYLSLLLASTMIGFLIFNFGRAKVFMGSCGSYIIGSMMYFFSISFLNIYDPLKIEVPKYSLLLSIMIIPIYDSLRVIIYRLIKGVSPFRADSNHIHHRLMKLNFSHSKIVFILLAIQLILIFFNIFNHYLYDLILALVDFLLLILLNVFIELRIKKVQKVDDNLKTIIPKNKYEKNSL